MIVRRDDAEPASRIDGRVGGAGLFSWPRAGLDGRGARWGSGRGLPCRAGGTAAGAAFGCGRGAFAAGLLAACLACGCDFLAAERDAGLAAAGRRAA